MPRPPVESVLTWICHPDDLAPDYVAAIEADMTRQYSAAAERNGFRFRFLPANELVPVVAQRPRLLHRGEDLLARRHCYIVDDVSADPQATQFLRGIYRTVDASDSVLLNRALDGPECLERDKLAMVLRAADLNVPTPRTVAVPFGRYARQGLAAVRETIGDGPYILKPREMGMGVAVLRVDTPEQLAAAVDVVSQSGLGYIVQECLPIVGDLRVMLVDGEVLVSLLRRPAGGNYRANLRQGGVAEIDPEIGELRDHCRRIAKSLAASYLHVDWLMTPDGPVLGEWGTAMAGFSLMPEPARTRVADAFFQWASRMLDRARSL
jgi:glutathione synthase/RimK-type ligase-like ATP-grasp enzyme